MKILVAVAGDESDAAAVETAVRVAHPFGGTVRGLYGAGEAVQAAGFRYPSLGEGTITQIAEARHDARHSREQAARMRFMEGARNAWRTLGADDPDAHVEWTSEDADLADAIPRQGGIYDLLVLGETGRTDPYVTEAALFRSGRPALFAPRTVADAIGRRIAIGWNRSAEAGRSVVSALPLLQRAERVTICAIETLAKPGPSAEACADYLAAHHVRAEIAAVAPGTAAIGATFLDEAARLGADLIVSGANYQSRLRELTPGAVTRYLLRHAPMAVLMAH